MKCRFCLWLTAILVIFLGVSTAVSAKSEAVGNGLYSSSDLEYYLDEPLYFFFRPGLEFELIDFEIPADLQPIATFSLKDPEGMPLDLEGLYTPGPVDVRMMLTYIPQGEEQKVSYHDRSRDRSGEYTSLGEGVYTYKFTTVLPADYDVDATHSLGIVATRDLRDWDLERYYDNDVYNFVPSGASEPMPRDIVSTETCNRCHAPLGEHGGRYQEVQVCQQCHLPALFDEDEGVSYSMDVMIHRVHAELDEYPVALNDCETCHTGGTPTADMPLVANPNPAPACDGNGLSMTELAWVDSGQIEIHVNSADGPLFAASGGANSKVTGKWVTDDTTFFLVSADSGDVIREVSASNTVFGCANNAPGTFRGVAGEKHAAWMTNPSRLVCSSCHTDVDFESGENHPIQADDSRCDRCHRATGSEYGISVTGAHTVDYKSAQLGGFLVDIVDIRNTGPGQNVTVEFTMFSKWGKIDVDQINRLQFSISGPNDDFSFYAQESAAGDIQWNGSTWTYRFDTPLPSDAMGSFSIGVEGRLNAVLNEGDDDEFSMNDQMQNFIVPFAVTDSAPMSRRWWSPTPSAKTVTANLSLHGSNRHDANGYCQTCHNPSLTDADVRPEGNGEPESVDFRYMIHKIHRGAELENGYVVYGYRSSVHDYSHVEYVGDLRDCEACHVDDSYMLPLPDGTLPVTTPRELWTPMLPETASCLSCHDSEGAAIHADTKTGDNGEACAVCHGTGKTYSVEAVHAR